jgi:hypothetical protein
MSATSLMRLVSALAAASIVAGTGAGFAFDLDAHRSLSAAAVDASDLDRYLREELAQMQGVLSPFTRSGILGLFTTRRSVRDWIAQGSVAEDSPSTRVIHHFHDPTRTWDQAGLRPPFIEQIGQVGQSSVLWSQNRDQIVGGQHAWQDARAAFLQALTLGTEAERQAAFSATFENLGHPLHHVQDAASPAHTRNDSHLPWDPDGFHDWAEIPSRRGPALALPPVRFEPAILLAAPNPLAPIPVARLLDTERLRSSGQQLEGTDIGLAEYSNANFFSDDRGFSSFAFPGPTGVQLGPPQPVGGEMRRYLHRVRDGQLAERLAVPSAFHDLLATPLADQDLGLDDNVFADYAALLFPRAVGYGAGLIDYFFRGRLAGRIESAADDPSVVRFVGTNASPEFMLGGRLELFGEDHRGIRTRLTATEPPVPVSGPPGAAVQSVRFMASADADRYVAVYRGGLGGEGVGNESDSDPGAVIGKVLSGLRVEQIFSDGIEWRVRTPGGAFGFEPALAASEYELAQWGDTPDRFVARTPFGQGTPNRVDVFQVERVSGAVDLRTVPTPGGPRVPVTLVKSVSLPAAGIFTGTIVHFRQTSFHQQAIIHKTVFRTYVCEPDPLTGIPGPRLVSTVTEDPELLTSPLTTAEFGRTIPLVVDRLHHFSGATDVPDYAWVLADIGLDPDGRVVGLVLVFAREPASAPFAVPQLGVDGDSGDLVAIGQSAILARYPQGAGTLLWALVDLEDGAVRATTADPVITLAQETHHRGVPEIWHRQVETGGCDGPFSAAFRAGGPGHLPTDVVDMTGEFEERVGEDAIVIAGLLRGDLRSELAGLGFVDGSVAAFERRTPFVYDCSTDTPRLCRALDVRSRFSSAGRTPAFLEDARRPPRAPGGERLVLLARDYSVTAGLPTTAVAVLHGAPVGGTAVRGAPSADFVTLGDAGRALALVEEETFGDPLGPPAQARTTLLSLDGARSPVVLAAAQIGGEFTVLEPDLLYRKSEMKLYRLASPLQRLPVPAPLAGSGTAEGSYHAVQP